MTRHLLLTQSQSILTSSDSEDEKDEANERTTRGKSQDIPPSSAPLMKEFVDLSAISTSGTQGSRASSNGSKPTASQARTGIKFTPNNNNSNNKKKKGAITTGVGHDDGDGEDDVSGQKRPPQKQDYASTTANKRKKTTSS